MGDIRFAVFTDLHYDHIHDGRERLQGLVDKIKDQNLDFIMELNATGKKVLFTINGHDHGDGIRKIGETYYFGLNAMSYIWLGQAYEHFSYPEHLHQKYPLLKDVVLYREGLFATITIHENGSFEVQGMEGTYQNISPEELGVGNIWNGRLIDPVVSSLKVRC